MLPSSELDVMNGIWEAAAALGRPVTTREVFDHNPELNRWKTATVLTFIGRLAGRGFIRIEKTGTVGKVNVYTSLVEQSEYQRKKRRGKENNLSTAWKTMPCVS